MNQWVAIAQNYEVERDTMSLPAILVDDLVIKLMNQREVGKLLDFGAGSGTLSRVMAAAGHEVTAYEPNDPMSDVLKKTTPPELMKNINVMNTIAQVESDSNYDDILCINVVDHLLDVPEAFSLFRRKIKADGNFILCIPHPMKNIGAWVKEQSADGWNYVYYRLDDYMKEGTVKRNREDVNGNLIIKDVVSQHRTVSTYYNWVIDAGFEVIRMHEPGPSEEHEKKFPAYYKQCSRIPYFWILECKPKTGWKK